MVRDLRYDFKKNLKDERERWSDDQEQFVRGRDEKKRGVEGWLRGEKKDLEKFERRIKREDKLWTKKNFERVRENGKVKER